MTEEIIADKGYLKAHLHKKLQIHEGASAACILVKVRYIMIDNQNMLLFLRAIPSLENITAVGIMFPLQYLLPLFPELFLILNLICLQSGGGVCAVGNPLEVNYHGQRLVQHPAAALSYREGKVCIFIVSRCKALVKAADFPPKLRTDHDGCAGDIISFLHIVVFRHAGVLAVSVIPGAGIFPDNAARLLKTPVRIDQLAAHHTDVVRALNQLHQG